MKILKLVFRNINSLAGDNEIDFTDPKYTNEGLFAITGKTGAGKSSILDAISLALYGKTPRVNITGSNNAVMTRGEKDCYAEITFEVAGETWIATWKQERTKSGNLKPVTRQIADVNKTIIADKIQDCDTEIVKIVGLDFEQFTKVILLAQGSFAAFLQAENGKKGELLEKITGTEIYSEISKIVFERYRNEQERFKEIRLELAAISILSVEEIETLNTEILQLEAERKVIDTDMQEVNNALKWLSDISNLHEQILLLNEKLPVFHEKANAALELHKVTVNTLNVARSEYEKQIPAFNKVRELDTKIAEKDVSLIPIYNALADLDNNKINTIRTLELLQKELKLSEKALDEVQNWANEHGVYEKLVSNYTAIENEEIQTKENLKEVTNCKRKIEGLERDSKIALTNAQNAKNIFDIKDKNLQFKLSEIETKKLKKEELLAGNTMQTLLIEKETITSYGIQLKSLLDLENAIDSSRSEIEIYTAKLKQFDLIEEKLLNEIEVNQKSYSSLESQIKLLDENIQLARTIQSLDKHRQGLIDGEECPLCGSLEHPFATGNIPQVGEKEKQVQDFKRQFDELTKQLQKNQSYLDTETANNHHNANNKLKEENLLQDNIHKQKKIIEEIERIDPLFKLSTNHNKIEILGKLLVQKREELISLNQLIGQVNDIETELASMLEKEMPLLQSEKDLAMKSQNEFELKSKSTEQALKAQHELLTSLLEKYNFKLDQLHSNFKLYKVENIESLKNCLRLWIENRNKSDELTQKITKLKSDIAINTNEKETLLKLLTEKNKQIEELETKKQQLLNERKAIFENKSVEEEETKWKQLIVKSEQENIKAEEEKNTSTSEHAKIKTIALEKEKELATIKEEALTSKSKEELEHDFERCKLKIEELSQKIGANKQILIANSKNVETSGNKFKEKEKQSAICSKWNILNTLIGSSDGNKYRNFAQTLTFEHLILLSNKQLQKMSERYILKIASDTSKPFELSVVDKFQNNDERTVQNLSGGEKFIISLSLALGLASMASKNMRIDTMFIDEGFGTLDSDYLDVALNALSNLQNEGKIVGVISHLAELKERIATHIEIIPSGNGHSKIRK